jgi:tetratricopeptide (TPR) repeat protein/tRNA A-37 threonylcarbamoyl transferase component Bud32
MFRAGDVLCERFSVTRFIARGGMGELYEADDRVLGERVALKTIRPEIAIDERAHQRFRREVQLARKVTHPNICRIFDLFRHEPIDGGPHDPPPATFVTMELLEGETLKDRLRLQGTMSTDEARPLLTQMADALAAAHAAGIVHRDFKSSNVMLLPSQSGQPARAVVTDFGLAYRLDEPAVAGASITVSGDLIGTPEYMAPEQLEGNPVTPATDVYALGLVAYEMLTGVRPFTGNTPMAIAITRLSQPPKPPRTLVRSIPVEWDRAIMRCLARDPADRFPTAQAVIEALQPNASPAPGAWGRYAGVAVVTAAIIVVGMLGWRAMATRRTAPAAPATTSPRAAIDHTRPAIAVLGFRNLARRRDSDWLSTALAEMLTTELAAGERLRTIPGETVTRMKTELALADADSYAPETLARIRQNLGTDLIVSGSFVTVGEGTDSTLRVDIRLQDSRADASSQAWLVSEVARSADLLDVVARAGSRLRERLSVDAMPDALASAKASQPHSPEATRLYAEGLQRLRRFDALGARALLERAVDTDPAFPLAHAALASAWSALGYDERARSSAEHAFDRSNQLARADRLQVEGTYREMSNDLKQAVTIWQTLATFFPDDIEHALRLANAQIAAGAAKDSLATIEDFKKRFPQIHDPRLDLAEAIAADTLSDFTREQASAARAAASGAAQGARLLVASARLREGGALLNLGQTDRAVRLFEEARGIFADAGDRAGVARTLNNLASAISDGPERKRAIALYEEGLGIARAIGAQDLVARFLNNLAIQQRRAGDLRASLKMNQESLAIRREIGDRIDMAISLNNIGNVLLDMGDLQGASEHYQQAADMSREMGDRRSMARALYNAAESLRLQGALSRARAASEDALTIRRAINDPAGISTSLYGLGVIASAQGDFAAAKQSLNDALGRDRKLDRRRPIAYTLFELAEIAHIEGDVAAARRLHQDALAARTEMDEKYTVAESQTALAALALEDGRGADAEKLAREAVAMFASQSAPDSEAMARAMLALALQAQKRQGAAEAEAKRAVGLMRNPQHLLARLPVTIAAARVKSTTNPKAALADLDAVRMDAVVHGIPRYEFEARRAAAEIEGRRSLAAGAALHAALRKDAQSRGFGLFAR